MLNYSSKLKYILKSLIVILFINIIITGLLYLFLVNKAKDDIYNEFNTIANYDFIQTRKFIDDKFTYYKNVLDSLESAQAFSNYLDTNDAHNIKELMYTITKASLPIFQLRFLDRNGIEKIRIEKDKNNKVFEEKNLQDKSDRYYFKKTTSLKKGEYYISNLDLNIEHKKIEKPYIPTIRISKAIYKNNQLLGILIINYNANEIINKIRENKFFDVYYMDKNGNFFLHPDKSKNYLSQLNIKYKLMDDFYIIYSLNNSVFNEKLSLIKYDTFLIFFTVFIITIPVILIGIYIQSMNARILDAIINNTPYPVFFKDVSRKFVVVNDAMLKILGAKNKNEVIGKRIEDLLESKYANTFKKNIDKALEYGRSEEEIEFIDTNSKRHFFDTKLIKISLLGKLNKVYILGIAIDITQLKSLNQQLENVVDNEIKKRISLEKDLIQKSKMAEIGNLLANLIHQWKNPLNIIKVISSGARLNIEANNINIKEIDSHFKQIDTQVEIMVQISNDFKNFFNPNEKASKFIIKNVFESITNILSTRLKHNEIEIVYDLDDTLYMEGYTNNFAQVILSILNNAIDEFERNKVNEKKIFIKAFKGDSIVIEIIDNAGKIDESLLPNKLFEEYETTKKGNNLGQGLPICRKIIEESFSGRITAYNINNNAVFKIEIPLV
ncbi:ATP-binding protein [Arcobacter arenosus]|uniref:PAS domain S-box protein n=1 Tax=Arcobacter arenosus TaxID=2576037 RepID=A0A5R8Y4Q4_9BACT|nr:ATP-binding protein [Arcobacter arenosus]TLP40821.1 PAS domain S-box protein [Arcobacter arenosus]